MASEARSKRITVVLTLAERDEQHAARNLKAFRDSLDGEQQQLEQLQNYHGQYLEQFQQLRKGLRASEMISYSGFIQRLAEVVGEQEKKLLQMQQKLSQLQQEWRLKHHRRKSVEDLIARLKREEDAGLERRLQQELDELAGQQHWHRHKS